MPSDSSGTRRGGLDIRGRWGLGGFAMLLRDRVDRVRMRVRVRGGGGGC